MKIILKSKKDNYICTLAIGKNINKIGKNIQSPTG